MQHWQAIGRVKIGWQPPTPWRAMNTADERPSAPMRASGYKWKTQQCKRVRTYDVHAHVVCTHIWPLRCPACSVSKRCSLHRVVAPARYNCAQLHEQCDAHGVRRTGHPPALS